MQIQGKVVEDMLQNFTVRWMKSARHHENLLLHLPEEDLDYKSSEEEQWNVQYFRSINSDSVMFDHNALEHVKSRKGRNYDDSIQQAYVHHIRRSKRFIYIENQYFMGSSHSWKVPTLKCSNLVPIEITMRIKQAIMKKEDFRVYVVLPLHPEGDPASTPVQEMLHWQYRTIQMMYKKIGHVIQKNKVNAHPTDYLSFFCLGQCEDALSHNLPMNAGSNKAKNTMRMMVYVHSKMAIFDDEYIIVGSANLNERSLNGNRDTEMACGAYQPNLMADGDVKLFRMALWAEHCGAPQHFNAADVSCMKNLRKIGEENLSKYAKAIPMDSHLMIYPFLIYGDGSLTDYPDFECFPGTGGNVKGKDSIVLPNSLTM